MHKNATKCNKTQSKWCINKHEASKIIDTFETYQATDGWQRSGAVRRWLLMVTRLNLSASGSQGPAAGGGNELSG
jgi:hypothetical protein